jgi:hypothetical protein
MNGSASVKIMKRTRRVYKSQNGPKAFIIAVEEGHTDYKAGRIVETKALEKHFDLRYGKNK